MWVIWKRDALIFRIPIIYDTNINFKTLLNWINHIVFSKFQVRQSWYILAGSISKVVTFLVKNDVMSQKHLDKLINNLMGKLDDSDASILSNIWDSALLLSFNYPVSFISFEFFWVWLMHAIMMYLCHFSRSGINT